MIGRAVVSSEDIIDTVSDIWESGRMGISFSSDEFPSVSASEQDGCLVPEYILEKVPGV